MESFNLKILTPKDIIYDSLINKITYTDVVGASTILYGHENIIKSLVEDKIIIENINNEKINFISSKGIIEVCNSDVLICVQKIEKII